MTQTAVITKKIDTIQDELEVVRTLLQHLEYTKPRSIQKQKKMNRPDVWQQATGALSPKKADNILKNIEQLRSTAAQHTKAAHQLYQV